MQHEIIAKKLEGLVYNRFNKKSLISELSIIIGKQIKLSEGSDAWDFTFTATMDNPELGIYGYLDIYYLKMKKKGDDGENLYITEVSYEFEPF
jgi:hypothetical protein